MKIVLKSLTLTNFKGIRSLVIPFNDEVTEIAGENEIGKTTIMDAFLWLLFGKDSNDSTTFNIKTLDKNNEAIPRLPHEVTGELETDGFPIKLRRLYEEKWTRKRGSEDQVFDGHETSYFIDDVPVKQNEYKARISSIVDEGLFKLLTNCLYFNQMDWTKRREILIKIAGNPSDEVITESSQTLGDKFKKLLTDLKGLTLDQYKQKISAQKKKIVEQLQSIPARIDEVLRSIPEPEDYEFIERKIEEGKIKILAFDKLINDKAEAHKEELKEIQNKQDKVHELTTLLKVREFEVKQEASKGLNDYKGKRNALHQEQSNLITEKNNLSRPITIAETHIIDLRGKLEGLREEWTKENAKEFHLDPLDAICPVCKRRFDNADQKDIELREDFNTNKANKLKKINENGVQYKEDLEKAQNEVTELTKKRSDLDINIEEYNKKIQEASLNRPAEISIETLVVADTKWSDLHRQIELIEEEIREKPALDLGKLEKDKQDANTALDGLKAKLAVKETIAKQEARKEELLAEERKMAAELSLLEGEEFVIQQFENTKINMVEIAVNSMFALARFRLFKRQINGGIEPCCDTLVNGVPYPDVNNAGKIQVGLDIIKSMSAFHEVWAPVWVDNSEAVNILPKMDSQLIALYVTTDKQLIIR
jgi:DNA repair exonuclease SbcCD ATPase subunit